MHSKLSRRRLLGRVAALGVLGVAGTGCGKEKPKPLVCTDTMGLSPADLQVRTALAYADMSATPGKMCSNCQQYLEGPPNACGSCKIVKGPINPAGNCKSYIAKPAS
jgi:hypothetical protein